MDTKICGISDVETLKFIVGHKFPPKFVGFISNFPKSHRNLNLKNLKNLIKIKNNKIKFVSVLVKPSYETLDKIKNLNFEYYQLYGVDPMMTLYIKKKYKKKIISAIQVENMDDIKLYKKYENISDIILFDSKGYEKSLSFNHKFLKNVDTKTKRMVAGNIKFNDKLDKFKKIADIIDISGGLETNGKKNLSKIDFFLKNIKSINK